jgi:hypothetical protein
MCAAIALKIYTWLYINDLLIKFEDGCDQPFFFGRVMPREQVNLTILRDFTVYMLLDFTVFRTFIHYVYSYIAFKLCTGVYIDRI